jgi:uncharacterized phage protein (TIGR02218 family)
MSFLTLEQSQASSQPYELYEFTYQGITQYFTSADHSVVIPPITYLPWQISRTAFVESGEIGKNNLTLTCPDQFPIGLLFAFGPPDDIVTLVVKRVQQGALDVGDVSIVWLGRVLTVDFPPLRQELTCESVFTSLRQAGARRVYTVNCPYALYGIDCALNILAFQSIITIDSEVGNVLNASAFTALGQPNGWWAGGKIVWQYAPGLYAKRGIKNHTGTQCEITFAFPNFPNGTLVTIAPGCDHTFSTCISKFANGLNFGGFPFMTEKNPWGSSSVF